MQVEVELARHAAEPTDINDPAEECRGLEVLVGDAARHHVDGEVDTFAAGPHFDSFEPLRVARVKRATAAEYYETPPAFRIRRGAEHKRRAHRSADRHAH